MPTRTEPPEERTGRAEEEGSTEPAATGVEEDDQFVALGGHSDDAVPAGERAAQQSTVEEPGDGASTVEEPDAFDRLAFAKRYGLDAERFSEVMAHDIKLDHGTGPATAEEKAGVIASVAARHGEQGLRLLEIGASHQEIEVLAQAARDGNVPLGRLTDLMHQDIALDVRQGTGSALPEEKFHAIAEVATRHGRGGLALLESGVVRRSDIDAVAGRMTRHDMVDAARELRAQALNEHPLPPELARQALQTEAELRSALRTVSDRMGRSFREEFEQLGVIRSVAELWNSGRLVDEKGNPRSAKWVTDYLLRDKIMSELRGREPKFGILTQVHDALRYAKGGHRVEIEGDADLIVHARHKGEPSMAIQLKALVPGREAGDLVGGGASEYLKEAMRQLQGWGGKAHNNPEKARPGMLAVAEVRIMGDQNPMYSMSRAQVLENLWGWFKNENTGPRREDIEVRHPGQPAAPMELRVRNGIRTYTFTRDDFPRRQPGDEIWYDRDLPRSAAPGQRHEGSLSSVDFTELGQVPEGSAEQRYWTEPEQVPPWSVDPTPEQREAIRADLDRNEAEFLDTQDRGRRDLFENIQDQITKRDARTRPDLTGTLKEGAGGTLVGEENFRKRAPSIDEKIGKLGPEQRERAYALANDPARLLTEFSGDLNDLQRYTVTYPKENYVEGTLDQLRQLSGKGYGLFDGPGRPVRDLLTPESTLPEGKYVKNFWREGNRYEGLNVTLVGPGGEVFELQFHTPESFRLKQNLTEVMYKVASAGDHVSPLRKVNALQELVAVNRRYLEPLPEGIGRFGEPKNATFDKLAGEVYDRATPEQRADLDTMLSQVNEAGPDLPLGGGEHPSPRGHLHELVAESTPDHRVFELLPEDGQGSPVRVHLERTPSGWSLHTGDRAGTELNERAAAMAGQPGFVNVVAHATPEGFLIDGHVVGFREVFDRIRLPEDGDVVRLIACEAGGGEAAARLAQEIGRPVVAADKPVWLTRDGRVVSASPVDARNDPYPRRPPDGLWKVFTPDGEAAELAEGDPRLPRTPEGWPAGRRPEAPQRVGAAEPTAAAELAERAERAGLSSLQAILNPELAERGAGLVRLGDGEPRGSGGGESPGSVGPGETFGEESGSEIEGTASPAVVDPVRTLNGFSKKTQYLYEVNAAVNEEAAGLLETSAHSGPAEISLRDTVNAKWKAFPPLPQHMPTPLAELGHQLSVEMFSTNKEINLLNGVPVREHIPGRLQPGSAYYDRIHTTAAIRGTPREIRANTPAGSDARREATRIYREPRLSRFFDREQLSAPVGELEQIIPPAPNPVSGVGRDGSDELYDPRHHFVDIPPVTTDELDENGDPVQIGGGSYEAIMARYEHFQQALDARPGNTVDLLDVMWRFAGFGGKSAATPTALPVELAPLIEAARAYDPTGFKVRTDDAHGALDPTKVYALLRDYHTMLDTPGGELVGVVAASARLVYGLEVERYTEASPVNLMALDLAHESGLTGVAGLRQALVDDNIMHEAGANAIADGVREAQQMQAHLAVALQGRQGLIRGFRAEEFDAAAAAARPDIDGASILAFQKRERDVLVRYAALLDSQAGYPHGTGLLSRGLLSEYHEVCQITVRLLLSQLYQRCWR